MISTISITHTHTHTCTESYADQLMKLCFTLFAVIMLATMFTVAEVY